MSRYDLDAILDMSTREILSIASESRRNDVFEFGLPLPAEVVIRTTTKWHLTGVKTKPAAARRKRISLCVLLNEAAALLEEEAQKILRKAERLRAQAKEMD